MSEPTLSPEFSALDPTILTDDWASHKDVRWIIHDQLVKVENDPRLTWTAAQKVLSLLPHMLEFNDILLDVVSFLTTSLEQHPAVVREIAEQIPDIFSTLVDMGRAETAGKIIEMLLRITQYEPDLNDGFERTAIEYFPSFFRQNPRYLPNITNAIIENRGIEDFPVVAPYFMRTALAPMDTTDSQEPQRAAYFYPLSVLSETGDPGDARDDCKHTRHDFYIVAGCFSGDVDSLRDSVHLKYPLDADGRQEHERGLYYHRDVLPDAAIYAKVVAGSISCLQAVQRIYTDPSRHIVGPVFALNLNMAG